MHYLDFGPMDEKEMAEYLGEMEDLKKDIPLIIEEALRQGETLEDCIRRNSLPGKSEDGVGISGGDMKPDKVYYTLLSVQRDMDQQSDDVANEVLRLTKAQDKLHYVERCIKLLPRSQKEIINSLFIKGIKCEEYGKKYGISRSAVFERRKVALQNLLSIYNLRFSKRNEQNDE